MRSVLHCRVSAGLLLVFWATAQCGAVQEGTSADQDASLSTTLSQQVAIIGQAVHTVTHSLVAELDGRLEDVQTRLAAQISEFSSRLDGKTGLDARLAIQVSELHSRLDGVKTELDARLDRIQTEQSTSRPPARDCSDLPAGAQSGVHLIQPGLGGTAPVPAYCDLDTDGGNWTVIQRRADTKPRQDFYLGWAAYKEGFGELDAEFWWGLDHTWVMTSPRDRRYELRIDLEDFDGGKRHAVYQTFRISSESDGYRLTAVNYTGDAGDGLSSHSGMSFSTKDRDQDTHPTVSCAQNHKGAWWYKNCHASNLNGRYLAGQHASYADGVNWGSWRGNNYSLKTATMKIRPTTKL